MNHYKSWADLNKQLTDFLCDELKERLSYFLTRYHKVHNSYGEMVCFSWIEMYHQEADLNKVWEETGVWDYNDLNLKEKWDANATYYDMNFLSAATSFLQMPIEIGNVLNSGLSIKPSENTVFSRRFACFAFQPYVSALVFALTS